MMERQAQRDPAAATSGAAGAQATASTIVPSDFDGTSWDHIEPLMRVLI